MGASSSKDMSSPFGMPPADTGRRNGGGWSPTSSSSILSLLRPSVARCDAPPAPPPLPAPGADTSSSSAPPPPPPAAEGKGAPSAPPSSSSSSASESQIASAAASAVPTVPNPGPYEHASMDAKRLVALDTHDGVRVDINKQLSPYMLAVHSFWLGTSMIPDGRTKSYSLLAQVADESGLLMARVDPERGSVDGRIHRAVLGGLVKVQVGVSGEGQNDQLLAEADFGGATWTGNLKYGSMGGGIVYGCNYFQGITPRLSAGGEGMYIAANQNLVSNYTVKYTMPAKSTTEEEDEKWGVGAGGEREAAAGAAAEKKEGASSTATANYNSAQGLLSVNYQRVVTPGRVTLGAELQCSPSSLESQALFGAEFNLTRSKINLCVDGTGRMQSVLEAKLGMAPGSPTLSFSAEVDHGKEQMRFGYGLNIGG